MEREQYEFCTLWVSLMFLLTLSTVIATTELNTNDILRTDLMPTSLFLGDLNNTSSQQVRFANGSVDSALMTMTFHRKMMNEYLCRGFLAEKILSEVEQPALQSRQGKPYNLPEQDTFKMQERTGLLTDEGSSAYKDWLAKVATLEDIYRNHGGSGTDNRLDQQAEESHRHEPPESREGYEVYEGAEGAGFTSPQLGLPASHKYSSGYEYPVPPPPYHQPAVTYEHKVERDSGHGVGLGDLFEISFIDLIFLFGGAYEYPAPPPPYHQPAVAYEHEVERDSGHGLGLGDLFEISLTGLAFLSFGMFVLQVLMCISMNKPQVQTMQMVDGSGDTMTIDENIRFRRWAPPPSAVPLLDPPALNELSRRALRALRPLPARACLHNIVCRGNKYSRNLTDGGRFWLPVWYLAVSWVQGGTTVAGLRASALGLGGADCDDIYPTEQC